ncbi:hypothetical protein EK21DRAFT_113328 [Setomelanomma holmii]|uniref:Uncharacterized protein n=1 Tax=Setomelanomma holmii TaxID=210430 RepID=A0A9P4H848_9PLEO|nr:hypothetical protein EK21DRAFT_113328 [Setomelanomma holmii]
MLDDFKREKRAKKWLVLATSIASSFYILVTAFFQYIRSELQASTNLQFGSLIVLSNMYMYQIISPSWSLTRPWLGRVYFGYLLLSAFALSLAIWAPVTIKAQPYILPTVLILHSTLYLYDHYRPKNDLEIRCASSMDDTEAQKGYISNNCWRALEDYYRWDEGSITCTAELIKLVHDNLSREEWVAFNELARCTTRSTNEMNFFISNKLDLTHQEHIQAQLSSRGVNWHSTGMYIEVKLGLAAREVSRTKDSPELSVEDHILSVWSV